MRQLSAFLLTTIIGLTGLFSKSIAQLPSYRTVAENFFSNYSHIREEEADRIFFAKKRDGWFVQIVDIYTSDKVKDEQLFWDIKEKKYQPLKGFGQGLPKEEVTAKIDSFLNSEYEGFLYGFERCRYFGYNEWDRDMISDFEAKRDYLSDTALEGLARAYAVYAERYLWSGLGGTPFDENPLMSKLARVEIPSQERIIKFTEYIRKSINCYKLLKNRGIKYRVLVGNVEMKILNEQYHLYQQLKICGEVEKAEALLSEIEDKTGIYSSLGHAYLNGCPKNSILITTGDNDTYPLWHVQEKMGLRKDVTVINLSLLGFAPYINMLKKNKAVIFSSNYSFYSSTASDFMRYESQKNDLSPYIKLPDLIKTIQEFKYPVSGYTDTLSSYPVKSVRININKPLFAKVYSGSNITDNMTIELPNYLYLNDFMVLDIINSNLYTRPICVTNPFSFLTDDILQAEGSVYRVLPFDVNKASIKRKMESTSIEKILTPAFQLPAASFGDSDYQEDMFGVSRLYSKLINNYIAEKNIPKAKFWAEKYINNAKLNKVTPVVNDWVVASSLLDLGYVTHPISILEKIAQKEYDAIKLKSVLASYQTEEGLSELLQYFIDILAQKELTSEVINRLLSKIKPVVIED